MAIINADLRHFATLLRSISALLLSESTYSLSSEMIMRFLQVIMRKLFQDFLSSVSSNGKGPSRSLCGQVAVVACLFVWRAATGWMTTTASTTTGRMRGSSTTAAAGGPGY